MHKFTLLVTSLFLAIVNNASGQEYLQIYHGRNGNTQIFDKSGQILSPHKLHLERGGTVTVEVVNANTLFYKYDLKQENADNDAEDKDLSDFLALLGQILATRSAAGGRVPVGVVTPTQQYKAAINELIADINKAKKSIISSEKPEKRDDALNHREVGGLPLAIDEVSNLPNTEYHFNNPNILDDLNKLADAAGVDEVEKEAVKLLNKALYDKVTEIKNKLKVATVWKKTITIGDTSLSLSFSITPIDKSLDFLTRDGNNASGYNLSLGTVIPNYKRAVIELVPVGNFILSGDTREFYLEDNVIRERRVTRTKFTAGAIANVNFTRFGLSKEMAVGLGLGYKASASSSELENFYISALFSYKNFIRIGFGVGFAQVPASELKDGATVGQPLPSKITNLENIVQYEERPSGFLVFSFTGLGLTKKK